MVHRQPKRNENPFERMTSSRTWTTNAGKKLEPAATETVKLDRNRNGKVALLASTPKKGACTRKPEKFKVALAASKVEITYCAAVFVGGAHHR